MYDGFFFYLHSVPLIFICDLAIAHDLFLFIFEKLVLNTYTQIHKLKWCFNKSIDYKCEVLFIITNYDSSLTVFWLFRFLLHVFYMLEAKRLYLSTTKTNEKKCHTQKWIWLPIQPTTTIQTTKYQKYHQNNCIFL